MKTLFQVLSADEQAQVHERTLNILAETGVRVETEKGRHILKEAGAEVDEDTRIVRFPRALVEESLRLAPKEFTLGARRPGWDLPMNAGNCTMVADGEGISVIDQETGELRPSVFKDWLNATRLIDALDEVGVYWSMVEHEEGEGTIASAINYWRSLFGNFSKHIQDGIPDEEYASWLLEVLQVVFGDKETIRQQHPYSFLLCPQSPLVIDQQYTDAYLALLGWDIPVAVMPMPLMGGTAPGSLIGTTILGNCDTLAMLCLIQAGAPGTPFIYAPALSVTDPRSGTYAAGAIENAILGAASIEMARYYSLPVEGTGGGTGHFIPGIQASYERALSAALPTLSWPDLLVGPGLLGGSMVLSLEQLVIDTEVFRLNIRAHQGINTEDDKWLDEVIRKVGPGGHFLGERSTVKNVRGGEWYISDFGLHESYETWKSAGKPSLLDEAHQKVKHLLATHKPLPLGQDIERELERIQKRAQDVQH